MPHNPKERLEAILAAALNLETGDGRARFVEKECAHDLELREKIERLLEAHERAGDFLGGAETEVGPQSPIAEAAGTVIGRYKLLEQIGEGGFGMVYMARQTEPVKRKVALKIIKLGMDTVQVIGRFESERQALAMMDHPNIAKVLDAGATETGRPYFVMEIVHGIPITQFCDENKLTINQRLELFVPICQAIQHAHQKGIIHRDLKPSNVLVTMHDDRAVPKVIDFGIAKATQAELTERTVFTRFQEFIGTPAYMSPEQAQMSGLDVDTRSDVYSLGVLLYELLTGTPPFDAEQLMSAGYDEIRRVIREEEPPKPSTRVTDAVSRVDNSAVRAPISPIGQDLDWIVMKALEKDRTRRYDSASAFAEDVGRYLNHDAVFAGKPGTMYKIRKFARRNKPMFATIGCVMVALLGGLAVSSWQALRATNEAAKAQTAEVDAKNQAAIAEAINRFFNEGVLGQANPIIQPDPDITLRAVLDRAGASIKSQFENQPLVEAGILLTIGESYLHLAELELAEPHLDRAYFLRARGLGEAHPDTLKAKHLVASFHALTRRDDAEELLMATLESRKRILGEEHPDTLESSLELSELLGRTKRRPEAEKLARKVFETSRRTLGENDRFTLNSMKVLATHLALLPGPIAEAERLYLETLRRAEQTLGESHHASLAVRWNLGRLYRKEGRLDEAQAIYEKALEAAKRNRPEDDFYVGYASNQLGRVYFQKGDLVKARPYLEKALAGAKRRFGDKDIATRRYVEQLAQCYLQQGESARNIEDLLIGFAAQAPRNWRIMRLLEAGVTQPSDSKPILPQYRSVPTGWRYSLLPPSEDWFSSDYDDATWAAGATLSGHPSSWGGSTDVWLRTEFSVESIPTETLVFWTEFRDELQLYLNGKLVARSTDGDRYYRRLKLADEHKSVLSQGRNVIAAHARSLSGSARHLDVGIHVISDPESGEKRFEEILTGFIQRQPSDYFLWQMRAKWRARHGQWTGALSDCLHAVELDPSQLDPRFLAAHLLLQVDEADRYRKHCDEMLARFRDDDSPQVADRVARISLLAPSAGQDLDAAARAAGRAVTSKKDDWTFPFAQMAKGLAELRLGNSKAAIEWCERPLGKDIGHWAWEIPAHLVVALAHHELGQSEDAEREIATARRMIRTKLPEAGKSDLGSMWSDWIFCQQLLREAEATIGPTTEPKDKS